MSRLLKLQTLLKDQPNDSFILFAMAKEYEKANQLEKAKETYLDILRYDSAYIGVYYHLGKLQEALDLSSQALETYSKGIDLAKKNSDQHSLAELQNAKMNLELELG